MVWQLLLLGKHVSCAHYMIAFYLYTVCMQHNAMSLNLHMKAYKFYHEIMLRQYRAIRALDEQISSH